MKNQEGINLLSNIKDKKILVSSLPGFKKKEIDY